MSIGRTIKDKDAVQTMMSFFPGDSIYVFIEGKQLVGEHGKEDLVMLHKEVAANLMAQIAMLCFDEPEELVEYTRPYFDFQKEKKAAIQDILDSAPVNLPPEAPTND